MKREIIITEDGSTSIYLPEMNETYHSKFGAIQEAKHVFIKNGLDLFEDNSSVSILEIGFGTGLNSIITLLEAEKRNLNIEYVGVEAYPVLIDEMEQLNYTQTLNASEKQTDFEKIHTSEWEKMVTITNHFKIEKRKQFFKDISDVNKYDLIYFDAFGFPVQPDLWSEEIFEIMFKSLKSKGILTTYACRTTIKKAMQKVGFQTEKLPGAPGKREMLRAVKNL